MKILLANSPFRGGGITTFATQLISCLSKDTELTVVLPDDRVAPIKQKNVKVLRYETKLLTLKNAKFFINLINNEIRPDIVICSMATIIPVIVPYLNDDIKVFTVSHSGKYFSSDYCAVNHEYLDGIIAASSDYNKNYLEKKFHIRDKKKITVVYNFVSDNDELESLRFKKREQEPIKIIYAGGASIGKAPHLMAKIVSALLKTDMNFQFYWTGNTIVPLTSTIFKRSKLKRIQQMMPNDDRLIFPGRIPDKRDFDLLLGSANIMMAPSINEGCSMALLEGHRAGSIFIVADYSNSNSEIVRNGKSGFVVNHKDIDAFVEVVRKIINNHQEYHQFYENSHDTFKSVLCYDVWKKKIFKVLNGKCLHKKRKERISQLSIILAAWRINYLYRLSLLRRFFHLSLPSYLSFQKQYKAFKKEIRTK